MMAFYDTFYQNWITISIGAASLSVIISAMLIMLSRLISLRNLEQVAKAEFVFAVSTVFIVIMMVGIIELAEPRLGGAQDSLARTLYLSSYGLSCNPQPGVFVGKDTLIDWMQLYMETPTKCVQSFMNVLHTLAIPIDAAASIYMEIFMSEHASGFGVKWISERIINTAQSFSFYMYIFYLLGYVFQFIKYYGGFFFSIGVALRAFPPTRGAGAYVMALSFGLYFIFPLAYITVATLSLPHVQSTLVCSSAVGSTGYACSLPAVPEIRACGSADIGSVMELPDKIRANADILNDFITLKIGDLERHLIHAICISPMIAFVILLTFVLNTTTLFGGNIPEVGRGLVKLI